MSSFPFQGWLEIQASFLSVVSPFLGIHSLLHLAGKWETEGRYIVRTVPGTTDWFQIGKGECQGCILSPCLFNFYAEYIMRNAGLEVQARIKIAGKNINNLKYADDTTLTAEREEELKSLLLKVEEENEKVGLKLNIKKTFRKLRSWHPVPSLHGK